ncbi:hypothetical protein V9T40_005404 [Parthenolecanium corni]|uniref:F-box domain-containing protein n=1 Tax=Parthenolecanium corni TaxID=536013 RepID=A0AAN9TF22_9HEMI
MVTLDIPYASPPQGTKYFTIIGPHIDCMDEQYLKPVIGQDRKSRCCLCCERGPIMLRCQLLRSAYVCGESIKLKATIDNQGEEDVRLKVRLFQHVEYFIFRGVLGMSREINHLILELTGDAVKPNTQTKWDSADSLVVPIMPPSLLGICKLIHIYYVLRVSLEFESKDDDIQMHFPLTIATVPFRIPNSNNQPSVYYDVASEHAEGGMHIAPEFLLGQVYDGANPETIVLYRPVKKEMDVECEPSTSSSTVLVFKSSTNSTASSTTLWSGRCPPTLDFLPVDVLLELFSYLNSSDVSNLSTCSPRIRQICWDHGLWRKIHDCCNGFSPSHNLLLPTYTDSTTRIKISSTRKVILRQRQRRIMSACLGRNFFKKLESLPNLKTFILENHRFDIVTFSLDYFPQCLTELRLNGSHIFRQAPKWNTVFLDIHQKLPNLETLDVRQTFVELGDVVRWPYLKELRHFLLHPRPDIDYSWGSNPPGRKAIAKYVENVETLVARQDNSVNDFLMQKLRTDCLSLKYLDISYTGCSNEAVIIFQNKRPDVELVHQSIESDYE